MIIHWTLLQNHTGIHCRSRAERLWRWKNGYFQWKGVTRSIRITDNMDGIDKTLEAMKLDEGGLIFINLVDFDMLFGHRNDPQGYGRALEEVDKRLREVFLAMGTRIC